METSRESVEKHVTGSYFLFKKFSMPHSLFTYRYLLPSCLLSLSQKHLNFYPNIPLSNLPLLLSLIIFIPHLYSQNTTHGTSMMPTFSSVSMVPYMASINDNLKSQYSLEKFYNMDKTI
jgi:hypothetical protein